MIVEGEVVKTIVERITTVAEGVKTFTLRAAQEGVLPSWTPGAHIDVLIPGGITRQYSLCGAPQQEDRWEFAVLREPASRGGSSWLHEQLHVGDHLDTRGPRNEFPLTEAQRYVMIAGGIGITPLLPMIHALEDHGAAWHLTYGGRRLQSMAFTGELSAFESKVDLRPEDTFGLLDLKAAVGEPRPGTVVYCCGPGPLIDAVERYCTSSHIDALHVERFRPITGILDAPNTAFEVILAQAGTFVTVSSEETIVEALERVGVEVLTSCGEGTCGTCETRVISGQPDHRDSLLTDAEHGKNDSMMLCCSRSLTPSLVLDL